MGKFLEPKDSGLQNRLIKPGKTSGKFLTKSTTDYTGHHKLKKLKRKLNCSDDQEPALKKSKPIVDIPQTKDEENQNEIKSEFQDLEIIELKRNGTVDKPYLKLVKHDEDLFCHDDLKARYDQFTKFNFIFHVFDEIALEGLDGITIEAFWKRFAIALKFPTCIDFVKEFIWCIICSNESIKFFELPESRPDLVILNREISTYKGTNTFTEVSETGPDIYKVEFAPKGDIWGSCATLSTRVDITEQVRNMTLKQAYSTYNNKLVMVADQIIRTNALFDDLTDPNYEYTQTEYCILEKIGRSREVGEITQGPAALAQFFGMDARSVFHYCKSFRKENLVTKQFFCVRSALDQNKNGRLIQLRRFYRMKKSHYMLATESIVNYLKRCPQHRAPYKEVRSMFNGRVNPSFFKNQEFLKYVNTQVFIPYRECHPDAPYSEYMTKSLTKERAIQVMQLKDPFINIVASWSESTHQDSSDDEDENDEDLKNCHGRIFNMEFIREVYLVIHSKGTKGCTTQEVNNVFDVDMNTVRGVLKKLVARNLISFKRKDIGRQKTNLYIATCFAENPNLNISQSSTEKSEPSSVIERLKEKQKQKIDSLTKDRIYTREQFEADQQHALLGLAKSSLLPVTLVVPDVICEYLVSRLPQSNPKQTVFLAEFKKVFKPFQINLTYRKLSDTVRISLRPIAPSTDVQKRPQSPLARINLTNSYSDIFKPDYLTKACLLQAAFGDIKVNSKEIIELLDPSYRKSKQDAKRDRPGQSKPEKPLATTSLGDELLNTKRTDLANYMGPNPVLISRDKDNIGDIVSELYVSTPPVAYKTGDITTYSCSPDIAITERVLSRINIILEIINKNRVFEETYKLLKIITTREMKEGYDKKMDRKSLHRIFNRLTSEGYIKLYQYIVNSKTVRRSQNFVCHPDVDHHHEIIRNGIDQMKFRFVCGSKKDLEVVGSAPKKAKTVETSPFGKNDVLESIQEYKALHPPKDITLKPKWSQRAGKLYGYRPKFARMSLLHEILFYLIYVLDKDTKALPKKETLELFKTYKINLTEEDLEHLPPVYCKELSWKMFISPLPRHVGWEDGWALICDVILRIPLTLLVRLFCLNILSTELQEILLHPIKRFYLIKYLSSQIQYLVMYKRKCIYDIHVILVRLAYCGLLQFGPARFKEKEQGFIYLNRKASLLETMTSEPGYQKVTNKHYNKVSFDFDTLEGVRKYWITMHNICMNTLLNARHVVQGKTITLIDVSVKPSLNKALSAKKQEDVKKYDIGDIPGDHRGAAGLDSALWSHIQKNWAYYAQKSSQKFKDELASLKVEQVMPEHVSFEHLQLPSMPNKFYLGKIQETKPVALRKVNFKKTSKTRPVVRKLMPLNKTFKKNKREYYDAVDKAILKKHNGVRFRPTWLEKEDKVLILLKVASTFVSPGTNKQLINYAVIRDILHKVVPESRSKTSRAVQRRFKILSRDIPLMSNMETLIQNLYKLVPVAQYFVPLRNYILKEMDASGRKFKLSEPEHHNAFIFMAYYMLSNRKEVESALHGNLTTMDYFNKENLDYTTARILPFDPETKYYHDPKNIDEIRKYVLKDILHSGLGHKSDHQAWSYQIYKLCQKFNQDTLKSTYAELRDQHMMSSKKLITKRLFAPYKLSLTYVFSQTTTFTNYTMEEAYAAFLDLRNGLERIRINPDLIEEKNYGQMFGLNEVITFMMNQTSLKFWFPEHHFILNPAIEDHGPVIEELAKRYQLKIKSSEKDSELQDSVQTDNTFTQITETEPGPSTAGTEDIEILQFDDEEPLDLTITATNSTTITNLKHWISDCIDTERVRSPSPELLSLDINHEQQNKQINKEVLKSDKMAESKEKEETSLSLEEIKEEILRVTPPDEKRKVPYITDLFKLLSENFEEIETDEQTIDEMKKHFVQQYPRLEELSLEEFNNHYLVQYLESRPVIEEIWKKVEREAYVVASIDQGDAFDEILEQGGTMEDIELASEIINFTRDKGVFGTTASEIREKFNDAQGNYALDHILKVLTANHILLRAGVCTIVFVHHSHQTPWLADTFTLTEEHVNIVKKSNPRDQLVKLQKDIDACLGSTKWIKIKAFPWGKVDGTLDKDLFKLWLSCMLSFCVENPKALLTSFFEKFCFLKPVDIFYLLEILQDLGCLEMRLLQRQFSLFSEYEWIPDCRATVLDQFEEIYVESNQISFCSLGSFFHNA